MAILKKKELDNKKDNLNKEVDEKQAIKLFFAADHAGENLKDILANEFKKNYLVKDYSDNKVSNSKDYALEGFKLAEGLSKEKELGKQVFGIAVCGTGIGISMALNRYKRIRAARVVSEEDVRLSREHNNANVIVLGGRQLVPSNAIALVKIFLKTKFAGDRHNSRVENLAKKGS